MKANELRVSNMIKLTDTGEIMTVTGIMQDSHGVKVFGITPDGTYCNAWIEHCEQITLTPEWLERFGFIRTSNNEYTMDRFVFRKQQRDLVINGFEYDYNGILHSWPESVHELQNLIHALTGTELTLTEPKTTKQNG